MAEAHLTCSTPVARRSQDEAERDAGQRIARLMASLTDVDRAALQATIDQVNAALEPFNAFARARVLNYANEAQP